MEEIKGIYVDLDSLLDTRLSMIYEIDKSIIERMNVKDLYNTRVIDEFEYLTYKIFRLLYRYRSSKVLLNAPFTKILDSIVPELGYIKSNRLNSNTPGVTSLTINVFPYNVDKVFKDKILALLYEKIPVKDVKYIFINKNPFYIDVDEYENNYYSIYMYDGMEWLTNMLNNNKLKNNIPGVKLNIPALLSSPILLKTNADYDTLFNDAIKALDSVIEVNFISPKYFNIRTIK